MLYIDKLKVLNNNIKLDVEYKMVFLLVNKIIMVEY